MTIKFCVKCTISNLRPRISFDSMGICSACQFAESKKNIDWTVRENELKALCDQHRKGDGSFDVIVPCSGGKDGSYVAHQLKHVYGMTPLCVTWAPLLPTDIGRKNLDAFVDSGFDLIQGRPNGQTVRKLTRLAFEHMGDPFQPFIYGQTNFPLHISVNYKIPLIMYGENGEVEYGGDMKNANRPTRDIEDHDNHYFSGKPPLFWEHHGITEAQLKPFMAPPYKDIQDNGTQIHFFSYYKPWDPQENFYYCTEHTGFSPNPERTEGTYSKYASLDDKLDGLHYYLAFIKFGLGRATSDASHEIRDGKITRDEGVALVKKFDDEFPEKYFTEACEYMGLTEKEAMDIINKWKAPEVWDGWNANRLKATIWK
jgi:N-acetyl sugar amidotransferase